MGLPISGILQDELRVFVATGRSRTLAGQTGSPLADGAVVGSASRYDDAADGRSADQAGLPGAHVDVVAKLEEAALA